MTLWQIGALLACNTGVSVCRAFATTAQPSWNFQIIETIPSPTTTRCALLEWLVSRQTFPTASQARRAIRCGEIVVLDENQTFDVHRIYRSTCDPSTKVSLDDQIHRITRVPSTSDNSCFPVEITKFVYPPFSLPSLLQKDLVVVYENNEMAVVHKPDSIVTIETSPGGKQQNRDDLQSMLPFILYPPYSNNKTGTTKQNNNNAGPMRLPRPVHRLDRGTSGLVIVAKTKDAMSLFSKLFADRMIEKTYTAMVFGRPTDLAAKNSSKSTSSNDQTQQQVSNDSGGGIIDYPIDGKPAVTRWKTVESNDTFSRIELQPKTGRYHQLRRHLAYCLGTPIVGDAKYDLVGVGGGRKAEDVSNARKLYRGQGLHLCCHELEFDYPQHLLAADDVVPVEFEDSSGVVSSSYSISETVEGSTRMRISTALSEKMRHQLS